MYQYKPHGLLWHKPHILLLAFQTFLLKFLCFKIIFSGESGFLWNLQWLRPYIVSALLKDREIEGLSYIRENIPVNTIFNRKLSRFNIFDSRLCFYQKSAGPLYFISSWRIDRLTYIWRAYQICLKNMPKTKRF